MTSSLVGFCLSSHEGRRAQAKRLDLTSHEDVRDCAISVAIAQQRAERDHHMNFEDEELEETLDEEQADEEEEEQQDENEEEDSDDEEEEYYVIPLYHPAAFNDLPNQ
ncbi:MAG TPA: hypothetical protein VH593_09220 [Ktedonobacteraceae bacterium]